jgi:hypothetical protein
MIVTFSRTGERRYRISVEGPGVTASWMEPAPGYDELLPHDMAHFVVENEFGIRGGVFGQLASGGTAKTFHPYDEKKRRKLIRRGRELAAKERSDADLSERLVAITFGTWKKDPYTPKADDLISQDDIERVCRRFDEVSGVWSKLKIGESMSLVWDPAAIRKGVAGSKN